MKIYKLEYDPNDRFLDPGTLFFSSYEKMRRWANQEYGKRLSDLSLRWTVTQIPKTKEGLIHWLNIHFQNVNA